MAENEMLSDLEFENQMNALGDDQLGLIKFVARQQYDAGKVIAEHGKRISQRRSRPTVYKCSATTE